MGFHHFLNISFDLPFVGLDVGLGGGVYINHILKHFQSVHLEVFICFGFSTLLIVMDLGRFSPVPLVQVLQLVDHGSNHGFDGA